MKQDAPFIEKKGALRRAVLAWYRRAARDLPWRGTRDPYAVWVSEVILQQTRVEQGTPYIERFLDAFPTVQDLAKARVDGVLKLWEGLGYYSRARNLHKAAGLVVRERQGELPTTAAEWMGLPGVGRYTAGAIASIAFGEEVPVLDGNVKRVLARLADLDRCIDEAPVTAMLWDWASLLVKGTRPGDFNQGLMELGARVCTPRNPACGGCPVRRVCAARQAGTQGLRPLRRAKKEVPHRENVVAAIRKKGRYLLAKRLPEGLLGGLWEFPGGEVRTGESHEKALVRAIEEGLGLVIEVGRPVASVDHAYSHFRVTLHVYACRHTGGTPEPHSHTEVKWVRPARFSEFAFPRANHKFLELL